MSESAPPDDCANCGAPIPRTARACPECGADERTGWRDTSVYDDIDLPDEAYEDDDPPARPTRRSTPTVNGLAWYWWAAGVCLLLLVLSAFVFN